MLEELNTASNLLNAALGRYFSVCSAIQTACYTQGNQLNSILQGLSDRMADELLMAGSYQVKLNQAKVAISLSRNSFTSIVPINKLPAEILGDIFNLALDMQHCAPNAEIMQFPKYPDLLSHVCSGWRGIAIGSRALWSHIDLAPCHPLHQGLLARAAVYANRSDHLPLYLHVVSLGYRGYIGTHSRDALEAFIDSVATRVSSLELVMGKPSSRESANDIEIIEGCLRKCIPGMLTQLTITVQSSDPPSFLQSVGSGSVIPDDFEKTYLDIPHQLLEDTLRHITSLRLFGHYPYWTSQAYQGLSELRLTSNQAPEMSISESELVNILTLSPGLRILQFDFIVTNPLPSNSLVTPVHLNELEVLNVSAMDQDQLGIVLRWLAPGSLPLQLSITDSPDVWSLVLNTELVNFFVRSNITKFYLADIFDSYSAIVELLGLLPYLRVLVLERCSWTHLGDTEAFESPAGEYGALTMCFRLDHLYMFFCSNTLDGLQWLIQQSPIRALTFWQCEFSGESRIWDDQEFQNELYNLCPVVEILIGDKPNPMDD